MNRIRYRLLHGYKYELLEQYEFQTGLSVDAEEIRTGFVDLSCDGTLYICKGYAWDGPSGPTLDTKEFLRPSLIHDALYQLMRMKKISLRSRKRADQILRQECLRDGMHPFRAWYVYWSVRFFAGKAASCFEENDVQCLTAP